MPRYFLTVVFAAIACAGATAAELRRAPYLQVPRIDGITIRWRTDDSVRYTSVVRFGLSPDKLDQSVAATEAHQHYPGKRDWLASLVGLKPDTKYYYALEADRATLCGADERHWFRTACEIGAARKLRFWFFGDSGSNRPRDDDLKKVLGYTSPIDPIRVRNGFRKFNQNQPLDGIILLGDNAYPFGTDEQYQASFFNVYADDLRSTPLWPCIGNHDIDDAYRYAFTTNTAAKAGGTKSPNMHYYSADIGNLHLVVLDPWKNWLQETTDENHQPWQKQLDWLKKDLAANKQQWSFVVNHFPLYCDGNYNSDTNKPLVMLRERLVPIFDQHGIDLCLTGHDHTYQRSYLLHGHTGLSNTFDPMRHRKSDSDGRKAPIRKPATKDGGTMYIVNGTGGGSRINGKFTHPALVPFDTPKGTQRGIAIPGSFLIELDGLTLTAWQIDEHGKELDRFSIVHDAARR